MWESPTPPGRRSIARRPTIDDARTFQHALALTVQTLSSRPEYNGVFGGPVHTVEQLRLASHSEAFFLPVGSDARTTFFRTLNDNLLELCGLETGHPGQLFKVVLKGFNQKVSIQLLRVRGRP